jgi:hypothetical protein
MAQYMLLLYDNPAGWEGLSPEEMQKATEKYMEWTQKPFTRDRQETGPRSRAGDSLRAWPAARYRRTL